MNTLLIIQKNIFMIVKAQRLGRWDGKNASSIAQPPYPLPLTLA